ncbi:MAG TPA: GAP family protein [Thermoleophilaceae bacterium]
MELVLIALWAAVYPTLLAAVLILLSTPQPRKLVATYLAGGMLMSIAAGLAIVALIQGTGAVPSSSSGPSWVADVVVGGLLLLVAVAIAKGMDQHLRERRRAHKRPREHEEHKEPLSQRVLARGSVPIVFAAGLAVNVPGAAYLVALKDIVAGHHSTGVVVFQILLFNLIMFLIAEVALYFLVFQPQRTDAAVKRMDTLLTEKGRQIAVVASGSLGAFLIVRGVAHS